LINLCKEKKVGRQLLGTHFTKPYQIYFKAVVIEKAQKTRQFELWRQILAVFIRFFFKFL